MSSLEEIKEELKKANVGSTPAVELQQAHNIEIRDLLKSFLSSVRGITAAGPSATATSSLAVSNSSDEQEVPVRVVGGDIDATFSPSGQVVPVQVVVDDTEKDDSDDSDNEEEGSQTSLLTSMVESFKGLGKGFDKFISVFQRDKKSERRGSSLGKDFDKGKEKGNVFKMAGDKIKSPLLLMVDKIKVIVANIMQWAGKIFGFLSSIFSPVTVVLIGLYSGLKDAFSAWTDTEGSMGDKIIASVEAFVNGFFEGIGRAVEWVANLIPKMLRMFGFEKQAKFVEEVIADVKEYVIEIYDSLKEALSGVVKIFEKAVHWVEDNWDDIKLVFSTIWDTVKEYASLMFDGVKQIFSGIKAIFSFASEWVEEHWDEIKAVIDVVWTGVKKVISLVFSYYKWIFTGIKAIFSAAYDWVKEHWDTISEVIDTVWTGVKKVISSVFSFYKSIFTGIKAVFEGVMAFFSSDDDEEKEDKIQAMKDAFTNMKEKLFGIFTSIGEALISFVGLLKLPPLSELIPDISKAISSFTSFLGDMVKKGLSAVKDKMMFWKKNKKSEDLEEEVVMTPPLDNSYEVSYDPASDIPIVTQTEKIGTGTIQTALNPVPEIPMVLQSAGNPTPATGNIVGLGYESVTQASTMQLAQQSLNQSKGETTYSGGGGNVNAANVNNSTNIQNTSVNNAPMPSSFDASDRSTSAPPAYMILR